ncbi:unnamed protein product [Coffea canephora]|uniref:Uncharacterized protein n=1 Tax=Coffea canephora TaxID=49390 RepID=A0A068V3D5_COFCA|nr:unnamed protein product [Coffea canephora]
MPERDCLVLMQRKPISSKNLSATSVFRSLKKTKFLLLEEFKKTKLIMSLRILPSCSFMNVLTDIEPFDCF